MSEAYHLFQQGLAALAAGHADEAIVPLERARRLEPDSMSIHEALGKTYLKVGFFDRAAEMFTTILDREPLDAYAHYCLARALDRVGDAAGAHHHYRLAAAFAPGRRIYEDTLHAFLRRMGTEASADIDLVIGDDIEDDPSHDEFGDASTG